MMEENSEGWPLLQNTKTPEGTFPVRDQTASWR